MKNLFFIALITIVFFGCSKKTDSTQTSPKTWIIGKWKQTLNVDTIAYSNGTKSIIINPDINEFNFVDDKSVSSSTDGFMTSSGYNYSLSDMTITIRVGHILKITKLSNTLFQTDWINAPNDPQSSQLYIHVVEQYKKEQ